MARLERDHRQLEIRRSIATEPAQDFDVCVAGTDEKKTRHRVRTYRVVTPQKARNTVRCLCAVSLLTALTLHTSAATADERTLEERCEAEVVELHEWIEQWSNAELPLTDEAFARFGDVIATSFLIVDPDGTTSAQTPILEALRKAHGRWEPAHYPIRIDIRNFRLLHSSGEHALAMYEEWHESEIGKLKVGRLSTVLFGPSATAPNGLEWLHLHESWVPGFAPQE